MLYDQKQEYQGQNIPYERSPTGCHCRFKPAILKRAKEGYQVSHLVEDSFFSPIVVSVLYDPHVLTKQGIK